MEFYRRVEDAVGLDLSTWATWKLVLARYEGREVRR